MQNLCPSFSKCRAGRQWSDDVLYICQLLVEEVGSPVLCVCFVFSLLERGSNLLLSPLTEIPKFFFCSVTELLILAHSCFSLTCHMEGITRVLQAARLLTEEHLAPKEEYGLVVSVCGAGGLSRAGCACPGGD